MIARLRESNDINYISHHIISAQSRLMLRCYLFLPKRGKMDIQTLKKVALFQKLSDADLKVIATAAETRMHHKGDTLFEQGDAARAMYVVHVGSVRIQQTGTSGDGVTVTILASGSFFGEMGFLENEKRSANAEVLESSQ